MTPPGIEAFIAVNRFGLGARPGELGEAASDPRGWLMSQLAGSAPLPAALAGLPTSEAVGRELRKPKRSAPAGRQPPAFGLERSADPTVAGATQPQTALLQSLAKKGRDLYTKEAAARTLAQVQSRDPLRERLVAFWSNHFTVSILRPIVIGLVGPFEREAIRPHVTGRFQDMLLAVTRHPTMLLYLDNARSTGPDSRLGQRRGLGLNENLARELLELHTLGVDGGYTQADVTAFAKILTGWSIAGPREANFGAFEFRDIMHEPGEKILLGERFEDAGEQEGLDALAMLARHPSTARHIARQFAQHFIADDPPAPALARFERVFRETDGDLGALAQAAIDAPEAWADPLAKVKTPNELVVSTLRATGVEGDDEAKAKGILGALKGLGQLPFAAPSPAGWPDKADAWIGASGVLERADFAAAVAGRVRGRIAADQLIAETIAPVSRKSLTHAVAHAASAEDAFALVLASPEFQRR
jgi:uncharacterized protein (DUF1800 family)